MTALSILGSCPCRLCRLTFRRIGACVSTRIRHLRLLLVVFILLASSGLAETGAEAWLRYAQLSPGIAEQYLSLPATLVTLGDSTVLRSARTELLRGFQGMLGRTLRIETPGPTEPAIVMGAFEQVQKLDPRFKAAKDLEGDAYALVSANIRGQSAIVITG